MTYQMKLDETFEEGTIVGERKTRLETARRALECGIPADTVTKFTGLFVEEVSSLL